MKAIFFQLSTLFMSIGFAQEIKFLDGKEPGKGQIREMNWLSGHWIGEFNDSKIEEVWTKPVSDQMMGMFRLYKDEIQVYEFMTISEENGSLTLKIKHFDKNMKAWEEKDKYEEFKLVEVVDETAYFDALTFSLSEDSLRINLIVDEKDGVKQAALFKYSRLKK